ncbi:MAG TPA: hypothetical protein DCW47_06960 [Lachnospiraceae bacterium]|nr:hypothetical protein [Lachnospiraceae bacterium]
MLNIEVQSCGLALVCLLIFFSTRHEKLGLYSEHLFRVSLYVNLCCIVLDILSVYGIVYANRLPGLVTELLCKLYLVSLLTASFMGIVYAFSDVKHLRDSKALTISQCVIEFVGSFLIMILPISYFCEGRVVYSYGPAVICTFIFAPVFISGAILISFIYSRQMNHHRRRAVRAWMAMELVAAAIQFLKPDLLLVGFGSSVGMMILYAELENPDAVLDRTTGVFSYRILRDYLQQLYDKNIGFSCIMVCSEPEWKVEIEQERKILLEMAEFLRKFEGTKLFRSVGNDFILVYRDDLSKNPSGFAIALKETVRRFKLAWEGNYIGACIMYMTNNRIAASADEFISLYQYCRSELNMDSDELIELDKRSVDRIKEYGNVLNEITQALVEDRIEVFYQPIYSFEKNAFVSAEALARLRDSKGGIMMPNRFIPVAEDSGTIEKIGERVLEKTCIALKDGSLTAMGIDYIEVNLSVAQCENHEFSNNYSDIMERHGLDFDKINLEVTESSVLHRRAVFIENMTALKESGCTFSLDDFGSGESNLNYIVDMPIDIVKFDRSMVMKYFTSPKARIVMSTSVKMVKELGYKIVAEGIETYDQLLSMKELGVDYIQGFYFSRPLPYDEFVRFIYKNNQGPVLSQAQL